jgi:hypothetical protein
MASKRPLRRDRTWREHSQIAVPMTSCGRRGAVAPNSEKCLEIDRSESPYKIGRSELPYKIDRSESPYKIDRSELPYKIDRSELP